MGGSNSRPETRGFKGCWRRARIEKDEVYVKTGCKRNSIHLRKIEVERGACVWEELPTPSSDKMYVNYEDGVGEELLAMGNGMNYEKLMQIIRCFPFPSPRNSPRSSPRLQKKRRDRDREQRERSKTEGQETDCCFLEPNAMEHAFGRLVQVSVETMAITALPRESIDNWLKERLKKWVQLSGHEGSIVPASSHTLYKKQCSNRGEGLAYEAISKDPKLVCIGFTPRFYRQIEKNEESFIEIEDLLAQFADPSHTAIMDIKVGTRTFLESEVSNTKLRPDLYDKMIAIDPDEPTEEEHKRRSITKLRYMQFRERESSSAQLGFRIEAAKMPGGCLQKNFKKVRSCEDVSSTLRVFFGGDDHKDLRRVRNAILSRLQKMRDAVESSEFFAHHEVVGSSLLLMYDQEKVGVWAIDFAKSSRIEGGRRLTHRDSWTPGNNEDGYLMGIDNLIQIVEDIHVENGQKR